MSTDYSITNGDGTISYSGMPRDRAFEHAQELADKHGESFFVAPFGYEGRDDDDLGKEVRPAQSAKEIFARITNTAREARAAFAGDVRRAYNNGDDNGDGFEPDSAIPAFVLDEAEATGTCAPDLDIYVVGDRLLVVGDKGGDWAVDITAAMRQALV